jgi:hypothetical protein
LNIGKLNPQLAEWFATLAKVSSFKAAVGKGQYEFPKGIIFDGAKPAWSNITVREFVRSLPARPEIRIVLDIHTGFGNPWVFR